MKSIIFPIFLVVFNVIILPKLILGSSSKGGAIRGIVVDSASGNPIEYANVVLFNSLDSSMVTGGISMTDGSFTIENIAKGRYYIKLQFIGYQRFTVDNIEINSNKSILDLGLIRISPASVNLNETLIIGNNEYITFKIDKTIINVNEQISAEGSAVVDALTNVPSIQVDGGGNVKLRGSASFTLLIDGQPSVLDPSDALNQIPASSIEKIEIITNPSVKYDSDGTTGIINLITKKQKQLGISGQTTLALATGDKYSANIMLSQRTRNIRTHIGATYSNKRKRTDSKDNREVFSGDSIDYQNVICDRDIYRRNYKFNGGIGWDMDTSNILKFDLEVGNWEYDRGIISNVFDSNNYASASNQYTTDDNFKIVNSYITSDFGFQHQFNNEDHVLDINLYYSLLNNNTPVTITQSEKGINSIPLDSNMLKIGSNSDRHHIRFSTDYTLPLSNNFKLETGYQFDRKQSGTNYSYDSYFPENDSWILDSTLVADVDFNRSINSLYAIGNSSIGGISIMAGLKIEIVSREITNTSSTTSYGYNDINLFPSLHLARVFDNGKQLGLSYSRRINRPNQWMLIPAPRSTGRNMIQIGNPELLPDFTNSFELSFSKRNDVIILNTQVYSRYTTNSITTTISERNGQFYQDYENLDNELSAGAEVMTNINITNWWRVNVSANGYYYNLKGTLNSGYKVNNETFAWNGSFRTTFIINSLTYLEFLAIYYGPSILPQGSSKDFYYFDFFIKRNFFDRRLTVALRSHNTFDTGIYIENSIGTNYSADTWFKYEGPTFMMTLTYRFNNFKRQRLSNKLDMNFDSGLDQ